MSLGNVTTSSHGANHGFPKSKEVFTDIVMEEALEDGGEDLQRLLEDEKPTHRQFPSPLRDFDEISVSYSSEDSAEVFTTDETVNDTFFETPGQSDNGAQAQYEAQANVQSSRTEDADDRVQTHEMARAGDQTSLTGNGDNMAQAKAEPAEIRTLLAEKEQPILTQQKVMDLIMQHQALPNNTSEGLMATTWATKKQGFTDMLSGFRSPTGTTYRVALDLASAYGTKHLPQVVTILIGWSCQSPLRILDMFWSFKIK
jgi:hypothetical protein